MENTVTNSSEDCTITSSPGGTTKLYTPVCEQHMKPQVKQVFENLDEGLIFYRKYALESGFDIRLGSTRWCDDRLTLKWRYFYCNREGFKNSAPDDVEGQPKRRRTISKRVGCMARVAFKFIGSEGYMITKFIEEHTHSLVPESYKYLMKMNLKLGDGHKSFLIGCAKANIQPTKGFRMLKEFAGSYPNVGCSKRQVKNFSRDLKAFVAGSDAQMLIDKLLKKRELCAGFYFEYEVDNDDHLKSLFWADPISRRNSCAFGDAVSFDATYSTNTYGMIFAPFTGKDNHGKCVTLGAALMSGESHTSYAWVLGHFKKSMGYEPLILMTDQDPAIKRAFEMVFTETRHRLCMWHIMMKLPTKVSLELRNEKSFMKELCGLVWTSDLEPHVFESRWKKVMDDFGLGDDEWFTSMYEIRATWIPAYFRETRMGGIFRTSSPSESENSFFKMHMSENSNLLQFFMHFESALDTQRHIQAKLNNNDLSGGCVLRTKLPFEKHSSSIYTRTILSKVQDEIEDAFYVCRHVNTIVLETGCLYEFEDRLNNGIIKVTYERRENNLSCSCQKFKMVGLLCSHIFYVFKDQNFGEIPEKYIVNRWTKCAMLDMSYTFDDGVLSSAVEMENNRFVVHDVISAFYTCLGSAEGNADKIHSLLNVLRDTQAKFEQSQQNITSSSSKNRLFEEYYQSPVPSEVVVKTPIPVKTKGSASGVNARKAAAITKSMKPVRKCSKCGEKGHHDARNCPNA